MNPDWGRRIGEAKAAIDNGFSRVGPSLSPDNAAERALISGAGRMIRLGNAVALLCKNRHAQESFPLLRAMAGLALMMRCIAAAKPIEDAGGIEADTDFWSLLSQLGWEQRLATAGVSKEDVAAFRGPLDPGLWGREADGLPWSHVFQDAKATPIEPDEALRLAACALAQSLRALDARWPGSFQGPETTWS